MVNRKQLMGKMKGAMRNCEKNQNTDFSDEQGAEWFSHMVSHILSFGFGEVVLTLLSPLRIPVRGAAKQGPAQDLPSGLWHICLSTRVLFVPRAAVHSVCTGLS